MTNRKVFTVIIVLFLTVFLLYGFIQAAEKKGPSGKAGKSSVGKGGKAATAGSSPRFGPRPAEFRKQIYNRKNEFMKLDINSDGFLSIKEYNGTRQSFKEMDTNGDGKLGLEEAKYMMNFADIPSGSFIMGTDEFVKFVNRKVEDASPGHKVSIDGFKMSATEVTTAQYCLYLNSALKAGEITVKRGHSGVARIHYPLPTWVVYGAPGTKYEGKPYISLSPVSGLSHIRAQGSPLLIPEHPLNQGWIRYVPELKRFHVDMGFEDWPAVFMKWYGAMAFAEHYGLSLPTEAEWEYAASGGKQFKFATSDGTIGCNRSNYKCYNVMQEKDFKGVDTPDEYVGFRMKVGSYPPNPYGVFDLAGNVWEWSLDWYKGDFYQYCVDNRITRNPVNLVGVEPPMDGSPKGGPRGGWTHDTRITRGGSYQYHETVTRTTYRFRLYPFWGNDHFGFRVILRSPSAVFNGKE
jgi:sulfatase modifying factor 1